jgi:hypothetical protein
MRTGRVYSVIDSAETVRYAFRVGLPLDDLLEFPCLGCGDVVFLTRPQHAAYMRYTTARPPESHGHVCVECFRARKLAESGGRPNE